MSRERSDNNVFRASCSRFFILRTICYGDNDYVKELSSIMSSVS